MYPRGIQNLVSPWDPANTIRAVKRPILASGLEQLEGRFLLSAAAVSGPNAEPNADPPRVLALIESTLPDQQLLIQSLPNVETIIFNPNTESAASVLERTIDVAKALGGDIQAVIILSHGA